MRYAMVLLTAFMVFPSSSLFAASGAGSIEGKIISKIDGHPIAGAEVHLEGLRRKTRTDAEGRFAFSRVPEGRYMLAVRVPSFGVRRVEVRVTGGEVVAPVVEFEMKAEYHEEVVVTSSPLGTEAGKVYQPTNVLAGGYLEERTGHSLGDTLDREPGVHSTSFSPASTRPNIRGFEGDRVLILDSGISTGDLSASNPDHAVAHDAELAQRIEVVRGPANLLYGSSAIGGVVNFLGQDIPEARPSRATGRFSLGADSAHEGHFGSLSVTAPFGANVVGHVDFARRVWDELKTPQENFETPSTITTGSAGLSFVGDGGFIGLSYRGHDAEYGIPVDDEVRITSHLHAWNARGAWTRPFGGFEAARFALGYRDFIHDELEDDELESAFGMKTTEGRVELTHRPWGRMRGTIGFWGQKQDFDIGVDEAIVPESKRESLAVFLYEEVPFDRAAFMFGARYESADVRNRDEGEKRSFGDPTFSAGLRWEPAEDWTLALSATRAVKFPTVEELYTEGEHHGRGTYELGDPDLKAEKGHGADLSIRWSRNGFGIGVTGFYNHLNDFIFLAEDPTRCFDEDDETLKNVPCDDPSVDDPVPVFQHLNADAAFRGFEVHADWHFREHFHAEASVDFVRAHNRDLGMPLPHIPPMRGTFRFGWHTQKYWVDAEVRGARRQNRVYLETPTPGYATYNLYAGMRIPAGSATHSFLIKGENLSDKFWRNHVSIVKDEVPMARRNVSLTYRAAF